MTVLALSEAEGVALIAAGATLAGIVVGGLITAATTAYFERRREQAETRQARRLVAEEIRANYGQLEELIKRGGYPVGDVSGLFPDRQWREYQSVLARHLHGHDWMRVAPFMDSRPTARVEVQNRTPGTAVSPQQLERLRADQMLAGVIFTVLDGRLIED